MKYLFITYDALKAITGNRFFQSIDFTQTQSLIKFLKGELSHFQEENVVSFSTKNGIILLSEKTDKKRGVIFDLTTFNAFKEESDGNILSIFTKTLRYAIRYFNNYPLLRNEKEITGTKTSIVYPYSFVASKNVRKVIIDRNSSKQDRKGNNFLTVFYYGNEGENHQVSFASLNKCLEEISDVKYKKEDVIEKSSINYSSPVVDLYKFPLKIDTGIGFDNWYQYLTEPQKQFIEKPLSCAERLEGAAGTGKTLTLILRCIKLLRDAKDANERIHIIFFTHSISTKDKILDIFRKNWPEIESMLETNESRPDRSLFVTTLQEWSMHHLGINSLNDNEYLDKDAEDSKLYQLMYIEQAFITFKEEYYKLYERKLSGQLKDFINSKSIEYILEVLQREFSEIIKGQCSSKRERYLKIERPKYGLKLESESDRRFIFSIFDRYQDSLIRIGQYDSDDIVLTALGQVDSPIWNRRRIDEGYDACFIDETHLFNLNELSLFHHVNKPKAKNILIYAIDRSQAIGENLNSAWEISNDEKDKTSIKKYKTIFRNTPEIAALAYEILSSGATLFTNLENPMIESTFTYTEQEESRSRYPNYIEITDEEEIYTKAFLRASEYHTQTNCQKSDILIVGINSEIMDGLHKYARTYNKPYVTLRSRSDNSTVKAAKELNKFVLSGIDFVGGLEFDYVIIVGAEAEHIPPHSDCSSNHILRYAWYNRLYVAITRAKYALTFLGIKSKGISDLLKSAIEKECLIVES